MDEETKTFLAWEAKSRDIIDVKRVYIDVAQDLVAGILLSQIVYWFLPDRNGEQKVTIEREGRLWLAKGREDWWEECRITAKQFDRASEELEQLGLVVKRTWKYKGSLKVHLSLDVQTLSQAVSKLTKGKITEKVILPKGNLEIPQTSNSFIEEKTTAEITGDGVVSARITGTGTVVEIQQPAGTAVSTTPAFDPASSPFGDGTRRLTDEESAAFEEICEWVNCLFPDSGSRREYRRLFMEGLTPTLLREEVRATLDRMADPPNTPAYFVKGLRRALRDIAAYQEKGRAADTPRLQRRPIKPAPSSLNDRLASLLEGAPNAR